MLMVIPRKNRQRQRRKLLPPQHRLVKVVAAVLALLPVNIESVIVWKRMMLPVILPASLFPMPRFGWLDREQLGYHRPVFSHQVGG